MPQLDFVSFFSQIFWFLLFFVIFYFLFLDKVVFYFGSCLKIRNKKLIKAFNVSSQLNDEIISFSTDYNNLFKNSIKTSTFSFTEAFVSLTSSSKVAEIRDLNGKKTNRKFLFSFGSVVAVNKLIRTYLLFWFF